MATKKPAKRKPAVGRPARRRRSVAVGRPARRRSTRKSSSGKFDIMQTIVMPIAGAGIGIIAANAIARMAPQIPMAKTLVPMGLAYAAAIFLKQPAMAAGMAAAGGIGLLNQLSPTMFADESLNFINEEPVPMINFSDEAEYDEAEYGELAANGVVVYDENNQPLMQMPDGSLQYLEV